MKEDVYLVLSSGEPRLMSKAELDKWMNEGWEDSASGGPKFLSVMPEDFDVDKPEFVIFKGKIVVPTPVQIVTKMEVE